MAAGRHEVGIEVTSRNMATRELDAAANSLNQLAGSAEKSSFAARSAAQIWMGAMMQIGTVITNFVNKGVALVSDSIIGFNARTEQALIGFTTMLGSAQKAQGFLEELQDFAAATPFEFDGLRQSANLIMAMGFEAREVIPLLTAAGDAVAALGLGTEAVQRVVYALGQMRAAGRVTGQDMMQLASMGIPAWKMLADAVGMTVQEAKKAAEQGAIDAETAIKAITTAIEEGNMGGMMAAQSKTFLGAISTIKDTIQIVIADAFMPLFETVSDVTLGISEFLGSADFLSWAEGVGEGIGNVIEQLIDLAEPLVEIATELAPAVAAAFTKFVDIAMIGLTALLGTLSGVFNLLGAIAPAISFLIGPLTNLVVVFTAINVAAKAWAVTMTFLKGAAITQGLYIIGQLLTNLIPMFMGSTVAATEFGAALGLATGGLSIIIPLIAAVVAFAASFVDFGGILNNFAMDFGDMGERVRATARSTSQSIEEVKNSVTDMAEKFELDFDDATYIINRFGEDADAMANDVDDVMEELGVGVERASEIVAALGPGWESSFAKITEASEAAGVSWETIFSDLENLNYGMETTEEILAAMTTAAEESPEAFARLGTELTATEQAAADMATQFEEVTAAIAEQPYSWIESVKQGTEGIIVTLTDGTEIIGTTADEVMGQISDKAEDAKEKSLQAISDMLTGIQNLFHTADDARTAIEEFQTFLSESMTDTAAIKIAIESLLLTELPATFAQGSRVNQEKSLQWVEDQLTIFNTLNPGMLAAGEDGGTGLLEGMQAYHDPMMDFIYELAGEIPEGMTIGDVLRETGYDALADYIDGIEAQEQAVEDAGEASAAAARRGANSVDLTPAGRSTGLEFAGGVRAPAALDSSERAGESLGRSAKTGVQTGTSGSYTWGFNMGTSFADGINAAYGYVQTAAGTLAAAARNQIGIQSEPRDPNSPLRGITQWGANLALTYADGIYSEIDTVRAAAANLAAAAVPGANAPAFGLALAGGGGAGGFFGESMGGGGVTIINHFGAGSVRSDDDIYQISRQLAAQVRMETI